MKKILLVLSMFLVVITGFAQQVAPDNTKPYLVFDASYNLAPVASGTNTQVAIYYSNLNSTATKAVQFRFWYDNTVFDAPTVTYTGTEANNLFNTKVDTIQGSVTVTWVYTGPNANFNIENGSIFNVALPFKPTYTNGAVQPMAFTGQTQSIAVTGQTQFSAYGTLASGIDTALGLQNYGGTFTEPAFSYAATFLNSPNNPSTDIPVILQKSSDGTAWTDVATANTDPNGVANFTANLDENYWQIRVKVASGITAPGALAAADADMIAQIATGLQIPTGTQFYTANPNQVNEITISDSYTVFSRLAQGLPAYANTPDILFFTEDQYNTIATATTDQSGTIPGQSTFLSANINKTRAANYYLLVLGDANGTGHN